MLQCGFVRENFSLAMALLTLRARDCPASGGSDRAPAGKSQGSIARSVSEQAGTALRALAGNRVQPRLLGPQLGVELRARPEALVPGRVGLGLAAVEEGVEAVGDEAVAGAGHLAGHAH